MQTPQENVKTLGVYAVLDKKRTRVVCVSPCRQELALVSLMPDGFLITSPEGWKQYVPQYIYGEGGQVEGPSTPFNRLVFFRPGWTRDGSSGVYYLAKRAREQESMESSGAPSFGPYRRRSKGFPAELLSAAQALAYSGHASRDYTEDNMAMGRLMLDDTARARCPRCNRIVTVDTERLGLTRLETLPVQEYPEVPHFGE